MPLLPRAATCETRLAVQRVQQQHLKNTSARKPKSKCLSRTVCSDHFDNPLHYHSTLNIQSASALRWPANPTAKMYDEIQQRWFQNWVEGIDFVLDPEATPKREFSRLAKLRGWEGGSVEWNAQWLVCFREIYPYRKGRTCLLRRQKNTTPNIPQNTLFRLCLHLRRHLRHPMQSRWDQTLLPWSKSSFESVIMQALRLMERSGKSDGLKGLIVAGVASMVRFKNRVGNPNNISSAQQANFAIRACFQTSAALL